MGFRGFNLAAPGELLKGAKSKSPKPKKGAPMAYDYIKKTYGTAFEPGQRVTHTVTKKSGQITREDLSQAHYVQVRFDDRKYSVPCHPEELAIDMLDGGA